MRGHIGVGVIGLGWIGRVHTSPYRRALDAIERSSGSGSLEPAR
jgi:hypothetical protein